MRNVNSTVETVSAAATAIVSAESRVQPTAVQKRRWGSCLSLYSCFGSRRNNKRIGHAVFVPEPIAPGVPMATVQNSNISNRSVLPFIAPPSSPASFLQSDPPSVTQSPAAGLLSLTVNSYSPSGPSSVFAIGSYAHETTPVTHETTPVTPPAFSAFTTETSTAAFTPPSESVHMTTTLSTPEVPFAQLLTSSLERAWRNCGGINRKFSSSHYEFQSHQVYPESPGANLISPGSVISKSGTSSPYPSKCPVVEFRSGEPQKFLGFEHFSARKWGSRFGSESITPVGQGSRLGSGSVTPNAVGISRLGSGTMTPDGVWPAPLEGTLLENQISEVASLANSDHASRHDEVAVDQSFFRVDWRRCSSLPRKQAKQIRARWYGGQRERQQPNRDRGNIGRETKQLPEGNFGQYV